MSAFDLDALTDEERRELEGLYRLTPVAFTFQSVRDAIALGYRVARRELLSGPSVYAVELADEDRGDWQPDFADPHEINAKGYMRDWLGQFPEDEDDIRIRRYVRVPDDGGEGAGS